MEIPTAEHIKKHLDNLHNQEHLAYALRHGNSLYLNGQVQVLTQSKNRFEFGVDDEFNDFKVQIEVNGEIGGSCNCKSIDWCSHKIASLLQVSETLIHFDADGKPEGKAYTREGMIKRVMEERVEKARKANYQLHFSDNAFGEHILINERDKRYKITFRNFEKEDGYCSCNDYKTNKLGTCKHLIFAFRKAKENKPGKNNDQQYPFIEIYLDPHNDYKIAWYYPGGLSGEIASLFESYFGKDQLLDDARIPHFLQFIREAETRKQILIRPEVLDKLEKKFNERLIDSVKQNTSLDFSLLKVELYPYQKQGITFATYRQGSIIADEMGLGKTLQAIGAAVFKKELFGFQKTLVICPASLKAQWKSEIEKFTDEKAVIVEGFPNEREKIYSETESFFQIINYETVLRDIKAINKTDFDFIILDEAQRIKNFETITSNAIKSLKKKHSLVITGTPIENKLIDLFSIVDFIMPNMLAPLWEFSYQHCYFDHTQKNKITGYYNLQQLKERLQPVLIRREKQEVLEQLNKVTQIDVPVEMHPIQQDYHASSAMAVAQILHKKFKTPYDMQMLTKHLQTMRMACDSSFLVDKESQHSPKLVELEEILLEKLDLHHNNRKIIIFSEWKRMNHIIGKMLLKNEIGFTEFNGSIPVKHRKKIIREFETNPNCRVFLSTEAGGAGLNLQIADTVINFELPWNPAKKNQRIGRIDRLGQKNKNLTVINLITKNSIEMKIASGLAVKQNLFDSVLSPGNIEDMVDFSEKGRAQFLQQLEEAMAEFSNPGLESENKNTTDVAPEREIITVDLETTSGEQKNRIEQLEELEAVMNRGMDFLSGMFKMSTGKEFSSEGSKIEVNKETGEVVLRFKLPGEFGKS